MQGWRKRNIIFFLVVWNLMLWISAAHLASELPPRSPRMSQTTNKLRLRRADRWRRRCAPRATPPS